MTAWLPQPFVSVLLFVVWALALNELSFGVVASGLALAVVIPLFTSRFWPEYPRTLRILPFLRLLTVVLFDIVVANVRVAWLILGRSSRLRPHFVEVPLDLEFPLSKTLLASIISLTPGTVSANLSGDGRTLLVHDLDVERPEVTVARIKARYERRLKAVFE